MSLSPRPSTVRTTLRGAGRAGEGLRRAAEVLAVARHPGVAELVELRSAGTAVELDLAVPEGAPLRCLALSPEEVAGVLATIATTVADLHDIGVAVGSVSAEDVTVTCGGHAVLTNFTRAARLDGPVAHGPAHPVARRDDRDLGRLLLELLETSTPAAVADVLDAPRRWARPFGGRRAIGPVATMRRLADRASTGGISSRSLAEELATTVPDARLPRRAPPPQAAQGAGAGAGTGTGTPVDDGALACWFDEGGASDDVARPTGRGTPRGRWPLLCIGVPAVVAALLVVLSRPSSAAPTPHCGASRNGCDVALDGDRYAVGTRGDLTLIGRWGCGAPMLALLRPATGQLWVYRSWPSSAAPLPPALGAVVSGGRRLIARRGATCDALFVVGADGRQLAVQMKGAT